MDKSELEKKLEPFLERIDTVERMDVGSRLDYVIKQDGSDCGAILSEQGRGYSLTLNLEKREVAFLDMVLDALGVPTYDELKETENENG